MFWEEFVGIGLVGDNNKGERGEENFWINMLHILLGIGLIALGAWIAIVQAKNLIDGKPNMSGGISSMLIVGLGIIAFGIIEIVKNF